MKTLPDRVEDVVSAWCGLTGFPTSTGLSILWGNGGQAATVPFQPQAVMNLITLLESEFQNSGPDGRDLRGFKPSLFAPAGAIDTVDDLVSAVLFAPHFAAHGLLAGFAHDQARSEFVNAIADEVAKRLKPSPAKKPAVKRTSAKKSTAKKGTKAARKGKDK